MRELIWFRNKRQSRGVVDHCLKTEPPCELHARDSWVMDLQGNTASFPNSVLEQTIVMIVDQLQACSARLMRSTFWCSLLSNTCLTMLKHVESLKEIQLCIFNIYLAVLNYAKSYSIMLNHAELCWFVLKCTKCLQYVLTTSWKEHDLPRTGSLREGLERVYFHVFKAEESESIYRWLWL